MKNKLPPEAGPLCLPPLAVQRYVSPSRAVSRVDPGKETGLPHTEPWGSFLIPGAAPEGILNWTACDLYWASGTRPSTVMEHRTFAQNAVPISCHA